MVPPQLPVLVLYGSVTGNAEHIAKDLATQLETSALELDSFKKASLATFWEKGEPHLMLVVTSTTGNGDAPENACRFLRYIKRCKNTQLFAQCQFAVLALGDTNYDKFCAMGRAVDKKLGELGGKRLREVALADEATGLEDVVEPWCDEMIAKVRALQGGTEEEKTTDVPATNNGAVQVEASETTSSSLGARLVRAILQKPPNYRLASMVDGSVLPTSTGVSHVTCDFLSPDQYKQALADYEAAYDGNGDELYSAARPFPSTIVGAHYLTNTATDAASRAAKDPLLLNTREIFSSAFPLHGTNAEKNGKRVIEIELSKPTDWDYEPGDSIGLVVPNTKQSVSEMLLVFEKSQGLSPNTLVQIDGKRPMSVQSLLSSMVDLSAPLPKSSKRLFGAWSQLLSSINSEEAACFKLMSSRSAVADKLIKVLCEEQRWTVVDFVRSFPSLKKRLNLQDFISTAPLLPPRYYSVASSPLEPTMKIAFSVVDYLTPSLVLEGLQIGQRRIHGLGTSWLEALASSRLVQTDTPNAPTVSIFPKAAIDFRLPKDPSTKLILIGPGTGIAPFMGFLRHRQSMPQQSGEVDVYFGCRHQDHDFLYQCELEELAQAGVITNLHVAFSRDGSKYRYVQDRLRENAVRLVQLVMIEEACVYLCGDGNAMAKDVQATFVEIFAAQLGGNQEQAMAYLTNLKSSGRFLLDIWST